jgi:quinol monooxygenase YgiN
MMMGMPLISFTVRMSFPPEEREAIADALRHLTAASRQEPGCISYIAHQVQSAPDTVLIYEQYKDEAALDAHKESAHFQRYAAGVLYQKMTQRDVEQLIALG